MRYGTFEKVNAKPLGVAVALTAGGAGDAAEVTGSVIDTDNAMSAKLVMPYKAVLAAGKSLFITVKIAESDDGSSFGADSTLVTAGTVATSVGGGTVHGVYELKINLSAVGTPRKRYLKFKLTPDLDAANTDTAVIAAALELGGNRITPVTHAG